MTVIIGNLRDIGVAPVEGVIGIVRLSLPVALYADDAQVFQNDPVELVSDVDGYWSIELMDTEGMEPGMFYYFLIDDHEFRKKIPLSSSDVNFNDLEDYEESMA